MSIHVDFGLPNKKGFNVHWPPQDVSNTYEVPSVKKLSPAYIIAAAEKWLKQNPNHEHYNSVNNYVEQVNDGYDGAYYMKELENLVESEGLFSLYQ
jgi:hypothetical protein